MPWDVFISHATEDKKSVAAPLASALKQAGISVWYDEFELKIGDGLRESIEMGLGKSRFGIVVLSPAFFEKRWPQTELDALLQQELAGESRILPIWYQVSAEEVRRFSPILANRVAAVWADGLQEVVSAVLKVVTDEPTFVPDAHQEVVAEPAGAASGSLVLLMTNRGYLMVSSRTVEMGEQIYMEVCPENPRESAFLREASGARSPVGVAFASSALSAQVSDARVVLEDGEEVWKLNLVEEATDYGTTMEASLEGHSADDIAELRARRILLDERLPVPPGTTFGGDDLLEMFVAGMNTRLKVQHSPLPGIYAEWKHDPRTFLPLARLTSILWLRLSGTIEHVYQLNMRLDDESLVIEFEGQRRRQYVNADPHVIRVDGTCLLRG